MDKNKPVETAVSTIATTEKEPKPIMTNCTMCRGEINIYSYRTYYTKTGIYCKCCVEKLPADE